jgi:acetoin utilization protein AcuB
MNRMPLMKSVMTPFPHSVDVHARLQEAKSIMDQHDIRHLPVTERGSLVGVVTARDLRRTIDPHEGLPSKADLQVKDIALLRAYVVDLLEPVDEVVMHMAKNHIDSALVVQEKTLVGIFTVTDACRFLGKFLRELFPSGRDEHPA